MTDIRHYLRAAVSPKSRTQPAKKAEWTPAFQIPPGCSGTGIVRGSNSILLNLPTFRALTSRLTLRPRKTDSANRPKEHNVNFSQVRCVAGISQASTYRG